MEEVNNTGNVIPGGIGDQGPNNSFNDEVNNDGGGGSPQSNAQNIAKTMLNTEINNLKNPSVSGITYKGNFKNSSIDAATRMFGNVQDPVPSPSQFIQPSGVQPTAKKSTLSYTPKAPSERKTDPDVKAAKKEIRKGGNVTGGSNVIDNFGHEHGYQSDKAKELDNSRLVSRKKRQDNRSEYKQHKIDVKQFVKEKPSSLTSSEAKKYAKNKNKEDRQEMRSKNRAERKRTKENRKESRR